MKNRDMAADYLEEAEVSLKQAELALEVGRFNTALRRSQDCVEFSVKALLRLVGIEYPREHEVSDVLLSSLDRFPKGFRKSVKRMANTSATLLPKRGLATYGDERRLVPAGKIFTKRDAIGAIKKAQEVLEGAKPLLRSFDIAAAKHLGKRLKR